MSHQRPVLGIFVFETTSLCSPDWPRSYCLSLPSAGITEKHHHAQVNLLILFKSSKSLMITHTLLNLIILLLRGCDEIIYDFRLVLLVVIPIYAVYVLMLLGLWMVTSSNMAFLACWVIWCKVIPLHALRSDCRRGQNCLPSAHEIPLSILKRKSEECNHLFWFPYKMSLGSNFQVNLSTSLSLVPLKHYSQPCKIVYSAPSPPFLQKEVYKVLNDAELMDNHATVRCFFPLLYIICQFVTSFCSPKGCYFSFLEFVESITRTGHQLDNEGEFYLAKHWIK
jgi:hypothetical protein